MAGFMVLDVWRENARWAQDCAGGDGYVPDEIIRANPDQYVVERGSPSKALWFARYTAPGYLDQTDLVYADTAVGAARECFAMYGDDEDPAERSELAAVLWQARKLDRAALNTKKGA